MTPIKQIVMIFLMSIILTGIFYIGGIVGILEFILSAIVYCLIFYFFHFVWKKIRKKQKMYFGEFINIFVYKISVIITLIALSLWGFGYYHNSFKPAGMPEITLSNGEKTVVFQAMSHIATRDFYDTIKENIRAKKQGGFVYFFEGVKPGTEENQEKFNQAIGVEFNRDIYTNLSKLYGVVSQNNDDFLGLVNNLDFNVDLSLDEIVAFYEEKSANDTESKESILGNEKILDANAEIVKILAGLNEKQLQILRYINKGILNFIIKSEGIQNILTENFSNKNLFDVILDKRDKVLAEEIQNSQYEKIYTTYGLLHFKGTLEHLQSLDPSWKIISERNFFPIQ